MSTIISSIDPIQNKQQDFIEHGIPKEYTMLTTSSAVKAALVFAGTIGTYYLAKTVGVFSYFGWNSEPKQSLGARQIMEVKNTEGSLSIRTNVEKVGQESSLSTTQHGQTYQENSFVEFEEIKVEKLDDILARRSISIQNPIPDQNATVGKLFELTINGTTVFGSSGATILKEEIVPYWLNSLNTNPELIGTHNCYFSELVISGNYSYLSCRYLGLNILDISNPKYPILKGSYDTYGDSLGVSVVGNYAYVADSYLGLQIINVTDKANPTFLGSYDTTGYAYGVDLLGNYVYVAGGASGLWIIDVSDPSNPLLVASFDTPGDSLGVSVVGNYAYVTDFSYGLQVIDVSNSSNPTLTSSYDISSYLYNLVISENYAYLAYYTEGLHIVDISNPENLTFVGSYDTPGYAYGVDISGDYGYIADGFKGLQIVDISNPFDLKFKGSYDVSGWTNEITVFQNYVYLESDDFGFIVIDSNLDKLTLSGTPSSEGTYDVVVRACNGPDECTTNSFNIIVSSDLASEFLTVTLIVVGSITAAICASSICSFSIIGGVLALEKYRNKIVTDSSDTDV